MLRYIYESRSLGKNQEGGILPDNPGEIIGTVDPGLMDFNAPLFSAEFQRRRLRVQALFVMRQLLFEVHCKEEEERRTRGMNDNLIRTNTQIHATMDRSKPTWTAIESLL